MSRPVAKIKKIDVSELSQTPNGRRAELVIDAEIQVAGQTYQRKFTVIADDHFIHHVGGPVTPGDLEEMVLREADKIQSLHDAAAALTAKVNTDLVAEVDAKRSKL